MQLRFATPHPFTTGQVITFNTHGNGTSYTNGVGYLDPGTFDMKIWVNDAYTVSFSWYTGPSSGASAFTTVNSATEYDFTGSGGWGCSLQVSYYPNGYPDEFLAAACTELGSEYHVNLGVFATDRLTAERARRIVAAGGPNLKVRLEHGNEVWNSAPPYYHSLFYHRGMVYFGAYLATGTNWLHYCTTDGQVIPFTTGAEATGPYVLCAGYAHYIFTGAWTTAGASGSRITRLMGTGFSQQSVTQDVAASLQQWGIPCDYVVLAPYFSISQLIRSSPRPRRPAATGRWTPTSTSPSASSPGITTPRIPSRSTAPRSRSPRGGASRPAPWP